MSGGGHARQHLLLCGKPASSETYRGYQVSEEGNDEEDQAIPKNELDELRVLRAPPRKDELRRGQDKDREVEAHGVDEGRRQDGVVRFRDRTSYTRDPLCRQKNTCPNN